MAKIDKINIRINECVAKLLREIKENYTWTKATIPPKQYGMYHVWVCDYDDRIENGWELILAYHEPGEWEKVNDDIVVTHYCPVFNTPMDLTPEEWENLS